MKATELIKIHQAFIARLEEVERHLRNAYIKAPHNIFIGEKDFLDDRIQEIRYDIANRIEHYQNKIEEISPF